MVLKALSTIEFELPTDWVYRGEGNANVVISLPKSHQILRIRKEEKPKTILGWFIDWLSQLLKWDSINEVNKELRDLEFYTLVMRRLLGEKFVCPAKPVYISRKEIKNLDEKLIKFRPEFRNDKRLQNGRVTLFQDYSFLPNENLHFASSGPTFSVEIKPKQGWIPLNQRDIQHCPYCLNQYLKMEKGQIKKISNYCPLDLFSGDEKRMQKAIRSLIENPQNNFRIFQNGNYVYGENFPVEVFLGLLKEWFCNIADEISLMHECYHLIINTLLKQFQSIQSCDFCGNSQRSGATAKFHTDIKLSGRCDYSSYELPPGCVLERILTVQKFDNEGLQVPRKKIDDWEYIEKFLTEVYFNANRCLNCLICELKCCRGEVNKCEDLAFVPYLIAAVARDCSLMLTFQKSDDCDIIAPDGSLNCVKTKFGTFYVNAGIFDLYPKPMSVLLKHKKRNEKMHEILLKREGMVLVGNSEY